MHTYVPRFATDRIRRLLRQFPAVAVLGPRQCGKSTLAKHLLADTERARYLDLEREADRRRLHDVELFFHGVEGQTVCLDEVQQLPALFPELRGILDRGNRPGQILLLGSASQELVNLSSESLAGRIAYVELGGLSAAELASARQSNPRQVWVRGGFPPSVLAADDAQSFEWREQFVRTFIERDLPQLGATASTPTLRRFWRMCAHGHAQLLNSSKLGESLGVDHKTVRRYVELLEHSFVLRRLEPHHGNMKKRLVKSPKLYVRDSGLLCYLLGVSSFDDLLGHPSFGATWEGFVIEQLLGALPSGWLPTFFRNSNGNEIDLLLERGSRLLAIECKASSAPTLTRGFHTALTDLRVEHAWVVAPIDGDYPMSHQITVAGLLPAIEQITAIL